VIFLQNGGWLEVFTGTVWNTSWLIKEDSIAGRLLHTLVGYSEAPNGAQLIAYAATIVVIASLMQLVQRQQQAGRIKHA
jgi:high-affinity iron transporter